MSVSLLSGDEVLNQRGEWGCNLPPALEKEGQQEKRKIRENEKEQNTEAPENPPPAKRRKGKVPERTINGDEESRNGTNSQKTDADPEQQDPEREGERDRVVDVIVVVEETRHEEQIPQEPRELDVLPQQVHGEAGGAGPDYQDHQVEDHRDQSPTSIHEEILSQQVGSHVPTNPQSDAVRPKASIPSRGKLKTKDGLIAAKPRVSGGVKKRLPKANKIGIEVINTNLVGEIR